MITFTDERARNLSGATVRLRCGKVRKLSKVYFSGSDHVEYRTTFGLHVFARINPKDIDPNDIDQVIRWPDSEEYHERFPILKLVLVLLALAGILSMVNNCRACFRAAQEIDRATSTANP